MQTSLRVDQKKNGTYISIKHKLAITQLLAFAWTGFSLYVALPWIDDLSQVVPYWLALVIVLGIAIIPGYTFAFILFSLLLDRRPRFADIGKFPPLTVLIAAYNEQKDIVRTIESLLWQNYSGDLEIIVIDDGSTDGTAKVVSEMNVPNVRLVRMRKNGGKARALNAGLKDASHELIVTVDADTYLYVHGLEFIVRRYLSDPPNTVAVAGAVGVRNSRINWLTKIQEWDYFHGIAIVKRVQSLYQGTLVAQGAFSLFSKRALLEVGGWPETIGEDIVLSWALLKRGYRIGYAEDAIVFTNVPATYPRFYRQRRRWARGLIEAFKHHPDILFQFRLNSPFIYLNLFFPLLDSIYLFCFVPGLVVALFGFYYIVGPMTLAVLPLAIANNLVMYRVQRTMFAAKNLRVRRNIFGFIFYVLFAQLLFSPASVAGYLAEFVNMKKTWGTK